MLSNEAIVLLLMRITKQFHKDPQSHWSPTAFVAVVEGDGSSFLWRGAGAVWGGDGQRAGNFLGSLPGSCQEQAVPWELLVSGRRG